MKKTAILTALAAITILASCADVPEDVRDPKGTLSITSTQDQAYSDTIRSEIVFECEPEPVTADKVYKLTMQNSSSDKCTEDDAEMLRKAITEVYSVDAGSLGDPILGFDDNPACVRIEGDVGGEIYNGSSAFMLWNTGVLPDRDFTFYYTAGTVYDCGEFKDDKITLADGSAISLNTAAQRSNDYLEKLEELGVFDQGEKPVLSKGLVGETENHDKVIVLRYLSSRFGLNDDDNGHFRPRVDNNDRSFFRPVYLEVVYTGDNAPALIKYMGGDRVMTKQELIEYADAEQAKNILLIGMAENVKYNVSFTQLRYCCLCSSPDEEHREYRPMWCFTLKEYRDLDENGYFFNRICAYVDAESHDIYFCDPLKGTLEKSLSP